MIGLVTNCPGRQWGSPRVNACRIRSHFGASLQDICATFGSLLSQRTHGLGLAIDLALEMEATTHTAARMPTQAHASRVWHGVGPTDTNICLAGWVALKEAHVWVVSARYFESSWPQHCQQVDSHLFCIRPQVILTTCGL